MEIDTATEKLVNEVFGPDHRWACDRLALDLADVFTVTDGKKWATYRSPDIKADFGKPALARRIIERMKKEFDAYIPDAP